MLRDFVFHGAQNFCRGGDEPDMLVAGAVLGLREEVGGGEFGISGVVGEDDNDVGLAGGFRGAKRSMERQRDEKND